MSNYIFKCTACCASRYGLRVAPAFAWTWRGVWALVLWLSCGSIVLAQASAPGAESAEAAEAPAASGESLVAEPPPEPEAPPEPEPSAAMGKVHVMLFGSAGQALTGVEVAAGSQRMITGDEGAASFELEPGSYALRLKLAHELVPKAPLAGPSWIIDVSDLPVVEGETTEALVTISPAGGLAGLDILAPESAGGRRSLEREFKQKLAHKPAGRVEGVLKATEGGAKIEGAHVYVRGAPVEAESDAQGRFSLSLPEGSYQLSVVHAKFSTQSVPDVEVLSGRATPLTIELSPASVELEEFVVTAPHIEGGIASLISERRESSAVADVIGAEQMTRVGATNAAAALSRVTGLTVVDGKFIVVRGMGERYSSMLVNNLLVPSPEPTRRVVPLDIFPSGILDSVVVQKTFSPDAQGEFGGGVIQLRTRGYPEKFEARLSLTGSYNSESTLRRVYTYSGGSTDSLGIDDGTRALPEAIADAGKLTRKNPLREGGFTDEELREFGKMLPNNYDVQRKRSLPDVSIVGSIGDRFDLGGGVKIGFMLAANYRILSRPTLDSIVRSVINTGEGLQIDTDLKLDSFERQISTSAFLDWGIEFGEHHKLKFTSMLLRQTDDNTTLAHGKLSGIGFVDIRRTRLGWVERQLFDQQVTGKHVFTALHDFEVDWRYSFARASRLEPDRRFYTYNGLADGSYEISQAAGDFERLFGDLTDDTHQAALDLVQPIGIWADLTAKLKLGAMYYSRDRDSEVRRFEFRGSLDPEVRALPTPEEVYTPERIESAVNLEESTQAQDAYTAKMRLTAGYAMLELPVFSELDIMAGARVERAKISVTSFDQFNAKAPPEVAALNNTDVLPAATATWRFIEDFQLRVGYGRTVNRPDLRELSSSAYFDIETASTFLGNPELRRARIDNVDARLEWYYSNDEVFSIGAFYKYFRDPIETVFRTSADIAYTLQNSDKATLYGLEAEARKRFDFLGSAFDALYLAINFSLIESEVSYTRAGMEQATRPLQSQSPWVVNAQFGYDDDVEGGNGLAASVLYNISGPRLRAIGNPINNIPDQYEQPFHQVDVVLSQRLSSMISLNFRARNVLNAVQRWTQGDLLVRRFRRGVYLTAGISGKF